MSNKDKDPYQEYLERKHGGFETPVGLVEEMVKKAIGSNLAERKQIIAGEVNEVYDVTTENNRDIIVRITRQGRSNFEAEEKAIRLARIAGVPAPKVLLIEESLSNPDNLTFCVEEKIEGEPLGEIMESLDRETFHSLISEAGEMLSKIHKITVDNFGPLDPKRSLKTWEDFIFRLEKRKRGVLSAGKHMGIDSELINKAFGILRRNERLFHLNEAHLIHGDFSPKHLLVVNNHINGIIDFEGAKGGDPVRDLAWLNYFYYNSFPFDWVKEGYRNKSVFDKDFDLKMKLYRLHMGLDFLEYYNSEKNEAGLSFTKERFLAELGNF
jgi:aminoglycoside phosphotransferase (APT) family kinase protein